MQSLFFHYVVFWGPLGYALIFLGMAVEGDAVLFVAGFLAYQGFLSFPLVLIVAFAGMIVGDFCWYLLGERWRNAEGRWVRWAERMTKSLDAALITHPQRTIFLAKFVYGLHRAMLIRAGMRGVPRQIFVRADLIASSLWVLIIGGLAFLAGSSLVLAKHYLKFAEVALAIALVAFMAVEHGVARWVRARLSREKNMGLDRK